MRLHLLPLASLALLSLTPGLAAPASALGGAELDCGFIVMQPNVYEPVCQQVNGALWCGQNPPCAPCMPIPRNCVTPCALPEVGAQVGNLRACVDTTPPNSAGTTCPPAYGSGKGVYLDHGAAGASPDDRWFCAAAAVGGAPCAAGQLRVNVSSSFGPSFTQCYSTTPPPLCSTPGNGWGVGFAPTCLVYLPWVERSPPAPTTCPPGTLAPVRVWWGNTPGFAPGTSMDVCLV